MIDNHAIISNIPVNPRKIYEEALLHSFKMWVDELGTSANPGIISRKSSDLSFQQAFDIIQNNNPHWVISYRKAYSIWDNNIDYWEFGGSNLSSNNYGEVFLWICVDISHAELIFKKYNLNIKKY